MFFKDRPAFPKGATVWGKESNRLQAELVANTIDLSMHGISTGTPSRRPMTTLHMYVTSQS